MSKIKAIIFDLDDTFFDTTGQVKDKALKNAIKAMIDQGLSCSLEEGFQKIKQIIKDDPSSNKMKHFIEFFKGDKNLIEVGNKAYVEVDVSKITAFPGAVNTLEYLKQEYKLVLISTGNPDLQYKKLETLKIKNYFDHILINQKETKEECFLDAIETLGINPNRIMGVGDRIDVDTKAANKLGLTSVRVLQGTYKEIKPKIKSENPDYEVEHISEIPLILENIKINEHKLQKGPKIAILGGGTGLPTLLEGLKKYTHNLSAIVTITDAGRSSGKLRKELDVLPPGDIRNNLIALSDSEKLLNELFQYRFEEGSLEGHCFGNLLIAALTKITGNFEQAIKEVSKILNLKGGVYPAALEDTHICAELEDGTILNNEQEIVVKGERIHTLKRAKIKRMFLNPEIPKSNSSAIERINDADLIVIGPGSLLTSVIPNLLIKDIKEAIRTSKAKKVYVCNIVTQPGQTEGFKASDHVKLIDHYLGGKVLDYAIVNNQQPSKDLQKEYEKDRSYLVENDSDEIKKMGIIPIEKDLLESIKEKKILWEKQYLLRHDSHRIAEILVHLATK